MFTIPIFEPLPTQYYVRALSDRWIGSSSTCAISFQHLILPEKHPPHTGNLIKHDHIPHMHVNFVVKVVFTTKRWNSKLIHMLVNQFIYIFSTKILIQNFFKNITAFFFYDFSSFKPSFYLQNSAATLSLSLLVFFVFVRCSYSVSLSHYPALSVLLTNIHLIILLLYSCRAFGSPAFTSDCFKWCPSGSLV